MSFKENLLTKIKIVQLSKKIAASIGSADSGKKVDQKSMQALLKMVPHEYIKKRDLELYILKENKRTNRILVLDNELAIYKTSVDDVVLRKSPTLKEMLSIRNAIKILNDAGVVVCKKEASINYVKDLLIGQLDLSFDDSDLTDIENDGIISLKRGDEDGVKQSLTLFGELLGYYPAPKLLQIANCHVTGALSKKEPGKMVMEPVIIYNPIHNTVKLITRPVGTLDPEMIEQMRQIASGKQKASEEGPAVFTFLKESVIHQKPAI